MTYRILRGDVLSFAMHYRGLPFHAILTDPPYHLTSITKRFSKPSELDYEVARSNPHKRTSSGFMNQHWDGGSLAFEPETWAAFSNLLYPGAFLMAFASSRGWHRMACAIEDAGFSIMPSIFGWCNGQPFPKATRIDSRIEDKELAKDWVGHRYGGQVLKNALEPIIVAQKPYEGRPIDNITATGTGALNIDAGRISGDHYTINTWDDGSKPFGGGAGHKFTGRKVSGRWPSNLILSHSPQCKWIGTKQVKSGMAVRKNGAGGGTLCAKLSPSEDAGYADIDGNETIADWECVQECSVRRLGEQSGELKSGKPAGIKKAENNIYGKYRVGIPIEGYGDTGLASRFFYNSSWEYEQQEPDWNIEVEERLLEADPVRYEAKAGRNERDYGLEGFERRPNDFQRPSSGLARSNGDKDGLKETNSQSARNFHPTVKPISLTRHLASLLLPPDRYSPRRLLIPFSGVASEMIGALLAGWDEIVGVEGESDYAKIGRTRLVWWEQRMKETGLTEPKAILKAKSKSTTLKNSKKKDDNPSLF